MSIIPIQDSNTQKITTQTKNLGLFFRRSMNKKNKSKIRNRISFGSITRYVTLTIISLMTVYPIWWLFSVSLKSRSEYISHPFSLPMNFVIDNYLGVFAQELMRQYFMNSIIVTAVSLGIVGIIGTMAGYALARYEFKMRDSILLVFLMSNMLPVSVLVIPLFFTLKWLNLLHGYTPLIISYVSLTLGITVFLSRGFFRSISQDVLDAARLDGCNELQSFIFIMVPLARAGLIVMTIMNFISVWNEYFIALVLVQDNSYYTIPLGLTVFQGKYATDWPKLAAALLLTTLPSIILFILFQEQIIKGVGTSISTTKK